MKGDHSSRPYILGTFLLQYILRSIRRLFFKGCSPWITKPIKHKPLRKNTCPPYLIEYMAYTTQLHTTPPKPNLNPKPNPNQTPTPTPTLTPTVIQPGNVLVHADGRFLLADFDVSKDTLGTASGPPSEAGPGLGPASSPCTAVSLVANGNNRPGRSGGRVGGGGDAVGSGDGGAMVPSGGGGGGSCEGRDGASEALTTRTNVAGTQGFMAPEVQWRFDNG